LYVIINSIVRLFNKRITPFYVHDDKDTKLNQKILLSSIPLLLFSFGLPFKHIGLEWVLDHLKGINQFRSVGRMSWAFYYGITLFCIGIFNSWISRSQNKVQRIIFLVIAYAGISFYIFESSHYHKHARNITKIAPNKFKNNHIPREVSDIITHIDPKKYQSILPLPMFYHGADNFSQSGTGKIMKNAMLVSYYSGLPMLANQTTRTSNSECRNIIQLIAPHYYKKEIKSDTDSSKPFLVLHSNETMSGHERDLLQRSTLIHSNNELSIYELTYDSLFKHNPAEELAVFQKIKPMLIEKNGFMFSDTNHYFFFNGYEDNITENSFEGKGMLVHDQSQNIQLVQMPPHSLKKETEYVLSFWIYNNGHNSGQRLTDIHAILVEEKTGRWLGALNPSRNPIINGNWTLAQYQFKIADESLPHHFFIEGIRGSKLTNYIDNVMVRARTTNVYATKTSSTNEIVHLTYNNQFIKTY
ncbi:MAG: hypothetical protein MI922_01025, partial [Bacteroidales bacterium]|nr:hypothetical protein [Bacteroidales bacterium]